MVMADYARYCSDCLLSTPSYPSSGKKQLQYTRHSNERIPFFEILSLECLFKI